MCAVAQVALGADLVVLALAVITCAAGLAGFRLAGAYNAAGWLAFFFVLGNIIVALAAKTLLFQPVDSRLYAPIESFSILTAGAVELLIAVGISLIVPVGKSVFHSIRDPRFLIRLSNSTFLLGTLFWFLNRLFQDPGGSSFGGIAVFWNLVLMAVIARTAFLLERSNGGRSIDSGLVLILGACVAMGLIDNSKTGVALPIVSYFATSLFYRRGLTYQQIAGAAFGLVLVAALLGPMIHAFRALGVQEIPWRQRIDLIERGAKDALVVGRLKRYEQLASGQFSSGYYDYFGQGREQMLVGRYASIQQLDPVIATTSRHSTLGGSIIWPAFGRLLPSFIYPAKPHDIESYRALVHLGLIDPTGGRYPTVPLLAQSYAAYGVAGVILIPLLTFTAFLLTLKKLGWNLHRNVFGIFFFCVFIVVYANQGDLGQYAGFALRNFPLLAALLWLLTRICRGPNLFARRVVLAP